ncbi:MAG TPA: beta-propeller domain-containing protein [Clostridiales bacterium]|nr:beta-propeller domain-containing protein [Clostridiales bacterium]
MQSESKVAEAPKLNAKASTTSETSNAGASASSDLQADNSSDYSTTNVQVQGVDEADIIKTDGKYIYQVNRDRIVIAKAYPAEEMKIESIISFNDAEFYPQEMYLHGNKLVVIGNSYVRNIIPQNSDSGQTKNSGSLQTRDSALTEKKIYPQPYYYQSQTVKAIMYDVSNKSDIKKLREFEIEGYYISSRKVGPYLYMVANKNIDYYYIMERSPVQIAPVDPEISVKSNQDGFKSAPSYRDTASGDKFIDIDLKNVCYFPGIIQPNYMIVAGINLDKDDEKANLSTYLGTGQNIYASLENLYVTVTNYSIIEQVQEINPQNNIEGSIKDAPTDGSTTAVETNKDTASVAVTVTAKDVLADSNAAVTVTAKDAVTVIASAPAIKPNVAVIRRPPMNQENTLIYKFSLNNGTVTYLGKGEVPGRILNQFSMDENDKYFRIATTRGEIWRNDEFTSKNNIYVLDEMLNIKGKVEDIAPGEQIYSVRFMGDRAYMVTFKLTDPLFVIDLKNPQEPCILGALKIPGYSDYLHPYDENHIIGFGKDSVEIKGQAFYLGMKIALFDVTDVSNPIQKFSETIGDRGTDSELLRNHKALLFSKEKELMAFPVTVMEIKSGSKFADGGFPNYGQFTFQGAYVYNIDLIKGFTLKSRITHLDKDDMLKAGVSWYDNEKNINRIIYINDTLYTLSNRMFKAHGLNDMKEKNIVTIP